MHHAPDVAQQYVIAGASEAKLSRMSGKGARPSRIEYTASPRPGASIAGGAGARKLGGTARGGGDLVRAWSGGLRWLVRLGLAVVAGDALQSFRAYRARRRNRKPWPKRTS